MRSDGSSGGLHGWDRSEAPLPGMELADGGFQAGRIEIRPKTVGEVQLGEPVEGVAAAVEGRGELSRLGPLQARQGGHQRHVHAEVVRVERGRVIGLGVQDYEFDRHPRTVPSRHQPRQTSAQRQRGPSRQLWVEGSRSYTEAG